MFKFRYLLVTIVTLFSTGLFGQVMLYSRLEGGFVLPAVTTEASGTAWFLLDPETSTLTYNITYAKLSSAFTTAHLHMGFSSENGPAVFPISFIGNNAQGTWTDVPDSIMGKLIKEGIYVNIHSANYPDGEIRGQLYIPRGIGYTASLNGNQIVPPNTSTNVGTAYAIIEEHGTRIHYSITVTGTGGYTNSSFNYGDEGTNGPLFRNIILSDSLSNRTFWNLVPDSVFLAFLHDSVYVNINSTAFPTGELRGQFIRQGEVYFTIDLDGTQEVPPVSTTGQGTGWIVMKDDVQSIEYDISYARLTGTYVSSHIHLGDSGVAGPVVVSVPFPEGNNSATGSLTGIADTLILRMMKGETYFNIHSSTFASGEIRGQIVPSWGVPFVAKITGDQEVPPVATNARGTGYFIYTNFRFLFGDTLSSRRLYYRMTVHGLTSAITGAHLRLGAPGTTGGTLVPITFADSTVDSWHGSVSDNFLANTLKGNVYVNIYTTAYPTGEIRGQLNFTDFYSIPVEVAEINVSSSGNRVELAWTTATETNNYGFDVERSLDNINYAKVGFVQGNGTTTEMKNYSFIDDGLQSGTYYYRIKQMDYDGTFSYSKVFEVFVGIPAKFELSQNYPNPFNPATTISFKLPVREKVSLKIFNVLGAEVESLINEEKEAGSYIVQFDAKTLASGVYFYELRTSSGISITKKMNLIK